MGYDGSPVLNVRGISPPRPQVLDEGRSGIGVFDALAMKDLKASAAVIFFRLITALYASLAASFESRFITALYACVLMT